MDILLQYPLCLCVHKKKLKYNFERSDQMKVNVSVIVKVNVKV